MCPSARPSPRWPSFPTPGQYVCSIAVRYANNVKKATDPRVPSLIRQQCVITASEYQIVFDINNSHTCTDIVDAKTYINFTSTFTDVYALNSLKRSMYEEPARAMQVFKLRKERMPHRGSLQRHGCCSEQKYKDIGSSNAALQIGRMYRYKEGMTVEDKLICGKCAKKSQC